MSATDQMRAMLDQLMGTARDGEEGKRQKHHFTDSRVCKSFLLDCCPHDILASTVSTLIPSYTRFSLIPHKQRMDIGECPRVHDLALRADYEAAAKSREYGYELDAFDHLQSFVREADRKTELAKKRLAETQEELTSEVSVKLQQVHELAEQIGKKLAAAEALGAEGNVEESIKMMEEVEEIKKEKAAAESEYRNSMPASSYQQQKLRVCEVCSAYLGIHDNDRRLADHFGGKLHLGFITIRERLEDLKKLVDEKRSKGLFNDVRDQQPQRQAGDSRRDRPSNDRTADRYSDRRGRDREYGDRYDRDRSDRRRDRERRSRSRDREYRRNRDSPSRSSRNGQRGVASRSRSRSPESTRSRRRDY